MLSGIRDDNGFAMRRTTRRFQRHAVVRYVSACRPAAGTSLMRCSPYRALISSRTRRPGRRASATHLTATGPVCQAAAPRRRCCQDPAGSGSPESGGRRAQPGVSASAVAVGRGHFPTSGALRGRTARCRDSGSQGAVVARGDTTRSRETPGCQPDKKQERSREAHGGYKTGDGEAYQHQHRDNTARSTRSDGRKSATRTGTRAGWMTVSRALGRGHAVGRPDVRPSPRPPRRPVEGRLPLEEPQEPADASCADHHESCCDDERHLAVLRSEAAVRSLTTDVRRFVVASQRARRP